MRKSAVTIIALFLSAIVASGNETGFAAGVLTARQVHDTLSLESGGGVLNLAQEAEQCPGNSG